MTSPSNAPPTGQAGALSPGGAALIGGLLIALGFLLNPWALERVLADDHRIESGKAWAVIVAFQLVCFGAGLVVALKAHRWRLNAHVARLMLVVVALATGLAAFLDFTALEVARHEARERGKWNGMVESEELLQQLSPMLPKLAHALENLSLPDADASTRALFLDEVLVRDLAAEDAHAGGHDGKHGANPEFDQLSERLGLRARHWGAQAAERSVALGDLQLWQPLLKGIAWFEHAKFYAIQGDFVDRGRGADPDVYETLLGFRALARTTDGQTLALKGKSHVRWVRQPGAGREGEDAWRIGVWRHDYLEGVEREALLFDEVLDELVPDAAAVARARSSRLLENWLVVSELEGDPFDHPAALFDMFGGTSPGVAVVDLHGDGQDDIFVVDEQDNQFLRGHADGTYEDMTDELGLAYEESAAALFVDLDNDGTDELFLGRNYARSLLLVQEGGRFVDRSAERVDGELPMLVSAAAAADYDNDGLLDLYVSVYGFSPLGYERQFAELRSEPYLLSRYLPLADAEHLDGLIRQPSNNWTIEAAGPPNVLLRNLGDGRLAPVDDPVARVFRNSFHSTWADFDHDGDPDLYVANDFAPNNMLRNDGAAGFVDITEETGTTDVGFGMGVTWGDYDNDGWQDLYVTNMYSKAGKRVATQFDSIDPRLKQMHRGNSLFRNVAGDFEKVSGVEAPKLLVEAAGWSWGSQFVDVDNDGWLDLYALSGMITAPDEIGIPVDI